MPYEIKKRGKWRFPLVVLALLLASTGLMVAGFGLSKRISDGNLSDNLLPTPTQNAVPKQTAYVQSNAFGTIIYGHWSPSFTQVRVVNTDGTNNFPIAALPSNIKDIHVLSNTKLLYIADTNQLDQGKKIVIYDVINLQSKIVAEAEQNFTIDDVIVSPDKSYIAWWEVKYAKGTKILLGADSSVYLKNINTEVQTLVAYEKSEAASPIHYPLFFDRQNRLFLDTFIPNQGREFYLGVSYVTSDNAKDMIPVPALGRGKFSSQPVISPNENKVAFLGFDPQASLLLDIPLSESLKRPELDNPNQVVLLDLDSFTSAIVADSQNGKQYGQVTFSSDGKSLIYPIYKVSLVAGKTKLEKTNEIEIYDVASRSAARMDLSNEPESKKIIDYRDNNLVYAETQIGTVAHLGETYESVINNFVTYDFDKSQKISYAKSQKIQYLSYLPRKGVKSLIILDSTLQQLQNEKNSGIQLAQVIVPEAKDVQERTVVQNDIPNPANSTKDPEPTATPPLPPGCSSAGCPTCCDIYISLCGGSCGHHPDLGNCPAYDRTIESGYKCYASPLYLYPEKTTEVEIKPKIGDRVYSSWPPLVNQSWKLIANPNGDLIHEGQVFNKIEYSYISSNVSAPTRGVVSNIGNLKQTLNDYGTKLGLINKELVDFTEFWVAELSKYDSDYFFISHFDNEAAGKIMSFDINPKSDTFIQVIMYFKPLEKPYSVESPDFPDIPERKGFTVVDWSGIVDWL